MPKELRKIIAKALAVSIEERYQTITDFIVDISRYLKSGEADKEKPDHDVAKEILETFEKASQGLSPTSIAFWPSADIGIAKQKTPTRFGLYYDLLKFPDNSCFFFIVDPLEQNLETIFSSCSIRGTIRSFLTHYFPEAQKTFHPLQFIASLDRFFKEDSFVAPFSFSCLFLDPLRDQMHFLNAGLSNLIHVPQGASPRILHNANGHLGQEKQTEFIFTSDNWNIGDVLLYHSLIADHKSESEKHLMEENLMQLVQEDLLLSAKPQAESILKKTQNISLFSQTKITKVVMSIQRTI